MATDIDSWTDACAALESFGADALDWIAALIFAEPEDSGDDRHAHLCALAINIAELEQRGGLH